MNRSAGRVTHAMHSIQRPDVVATLTGGGPALATPIARNDSHECEALVRQQLELLGENPNREGLLKTPERVAKAMQWLTRGYDLQLEDIVGDAIFEEAHENMVLVRDIEFYS